MYWAGKAVTRIGLGRGELAGRVAVVTGSGRSVGRETAFALAYLGATVVVADMSYAGARTVDEICSAGGSSAAIRTDVSREDHVDRLVRSARNLFGSVDIVINTVCACDGTSMGDINAELREQSVARSLGGVRLMCRAFLPEMLDRGSGTIVNMLSADTSSCCSAYGSVRHGLAKLNRALTAEVGEEDISIVTLPIGMVGSAREQIVSAEPLNDTGPVGDDPCAVSVHPAHDGVMPADCAGAVAAYLICKLACEYHGEVVTGRAVLERTDLTCDNLG